MDHIEKHLDERLTLEDLARVACFSRFRFHRIFTACVGESLYHFILRLRLERAANQLLRHPDRSITAIALDCGFGSSAAFARAFHAAFGGSASAFRAAGGKNRETMGNAGEERDRAAGYASSGAVRDGAGSQTLQKGPMPANPSLPPLKPAAEMRIEDIQPFTVAYVRHIGPFVGNATLFGRLFGRLRQWAGPRGLLGSGARVLTIYHDRPEITARERLRISACVTVPPGTKPTSEIGVTQVDGGRYVVATFVLDPSEYRAARDWLMGTWFPESGYQPDDRTSFEVYLNDASVPLPEQHHVEIWEPVRPL